MQFATNIIFKELYLKHLEIIGFQFKYSLNKTNSFDIINKYFTIVRNRKIPIARI